MCFPNSSQLRLCLNITVALFHSFSELTINLKEGKNAVNQSRVHSQKQITLLFKMLKNNAFYWTFQVISIKLQLGGFDIYNDNNDNYKK